MLAMQEITASNHLFQRKGKNQAPAVGPAISNTTRGKVYAKNTKI